MTVCVAWAAIEAAATRAMDSGPHEVSVCDANCRDYHCKVVATADAEGRVLGLECDVIVDSGAYSPWPWPAGSKAGLRWAICRAAMTFAAFRAARSHREQQAGGQPFRGVARPLFLLRARDRPWMRWRRPWDRTRLEVGYEIFVRPDQMPYVSITKEDPGQRRLVARCSSARPP